MGIGLRRPRLLAAALVLGAAGTAAAAAELSGQVQLLAKGGRTVDRSADVRNAVVSFMPAGGVQGLPGGQTFTMATQKKEFTPRVLAVPRGATVRFPNEDPILHNVFSLSAGNTFDLGLYRKGTGKSWTFEAPGVARVFCNIHHSMVAYVLVLDTPPHAFPDAAGAFTLAGLPAGEGTLTVWHEQAEPWTSVISLPRGEPVAARLTVTKPRLPPHRNKLGQAYDKRGTDY
jgi:plastocyanin